MWDQGSREWDPGSEGWDLRSQPLDQGSQTMGSGSAVFFLWIRDQVVPYLWDQGQKLVTLLESRIRHLRTRELLSLSYAFRQRRSCPL